MNGTQQARDGQLSKSNFTSQDNPLNLSAQYSNNNYNNYYNNNQNNNIDINTYKYLKNPERSLSRSQTSQSNQQQYNQSNPNLTQASSFNMATPRKDSEIRVDMENLSKQAYKRALDQQVVEKQVNKYNEERDRRQNEMDIIPQYPFGRRTNPSYLIENNYVPSSYNNYSGRPNYENVDPYGVEGPLRLDKNSIVEKPNSLVDDNPPYDPVKNPGAPGGNFYDPWGKPGGGAPMIDPDTGKKYTKISGQLHYDTLGLSPSARQRYKETAIRQQMLNLEEQKQEIELEQQRRKQEEANVRGRAGDVATWIQDIEGSRWPLRTHLNHTNVTREKVNLESVRRGLNEKTRIYHDELGLQLEEKERQNKLHKLRDDVAGVEHTRKWNDWWGRPGGGAPTVDRRRHETHEILESPRYSWDQNMDQTSYSAPGTSLPLNNTRSVTNQMGTGQFLFTKGTVRSNHKNFFENVQQMK